MLNLAEYRQRPALLADWLPWAGLEAPAAIPDPYTGGHAHFEQVWQLVDAAAVGTVRRLLHDAESGIIGA